MKLMKESRELLRVFNPWHKFEWVLGLLGLVSGCFAISIVPFTRKDFGERYLGWINLFFGYTIVGNFAFLGNVIGVASGGQFSWLMVLCWLAFVGASLYHRVEITRKNKAGKDWHSMCMGTTLLPLLLSEEKIFKIVEPGLVFLVGLLAYQFSWQVGIWLMVGGVCLFVSNHLVYHFERQLILDVRDAQIEARYASQAIAGRPARETGGFVVAESNIQMIRKDAGLRQIFGNLSSEMKDLFDAQPVFARSTMKGV